MSRCIYQLLIIASLNLLLSPLSLAETRPSESPSEDGEFTLTAIYFNATDAIDSIEFFPYYENHLGARTNISALKKICQSITQHYKTKGYDFARCNIPAQTFADGVVYMHITEGIIAAVRLTGEVDEHDSLLNSYIKKISLNQPLQKSQLHYVVYMLDAIPGINVNTYTRPMPDSNVFELVFDIKRVNFSGEIYANNRGSKILGPVQVGVSLANFSLLGLHEYIRLHLLATKETDELKSAEINTSWPVQSDGSYLIIESTYADSEPGYILESENLHIKTSSVNLGWTRPVSVTSTDSLTLTGYIDYIELDTEITGIQTALDELYKIRLSLDHLSRSALRHTRSNVTFVHGLGGLNTTVTIPDTQTGIQVSTGKEDFSLAKFDLLYTTVLSQNLLLTSQLQGQYAFHDLPVSEYIYFGGESIGNAYDTAELFGDHGLGGSTRLAYHLKNASPTPGYTHLYTQYDLARVWNNTLDTITSGASLAAGFNISSKSYHFNVQAAKPLTKQVLLEGDRDIRYFASARLFF